jgi:hypothetical protein
MAARAPRPEGEPEERERRVLCRAAPYRVLAVDQPGLVRVQAQAHLSHPLLQRGPDHPGLLLGAAVHHGVVDVPLERDRREFPRQPHIERVMQEQVSEYW